ncbi:uncharacterized protein LOC103849567 [Brassica rapa]|uniref:uncharacterized protein LOC103849567 n=1 Tax=Brassica campestris TaxID=3711 RepID=UPI00142E3EB4|nr:uncharacterized protein LOC103849567 [Brassica rapa]
MRIGINRKREPWFALGDFNEIVSNQEKIGGRVRPEASFHDFGSMMRTCGFTDLQSVGDRFSWAGQRGSHLVRCCLDRTMATGSWFDLFPVSHTEYLEMGESDHRPMITFMSAEREKPRRFFRYDNRMLHKEGFKDTVRRGWCGMGQSQLVRIPLTQRISRCRQHISQWKRLNRNNAEERISSLRNKLDNAVTSTAFSTEERNAIKDDLNQAYLEEEIYWKQKSRITWLRSGDRNTRYFHAVTKARRTRNTISSIQDEHGVIRKGHKEVAEVATTYFQNLFSSEEINLNLYNEVFLGFTPRVTQDMNDDLTKPITEEEVQAALFDMGPHRAPGPDGFSAVFYQKFWSECKADIMEEIDKFFNTGELDQQHNHTNLCLIPKIYPPMGMKEFRPIALCNVSYKIISKILVNRLKTHLPNIISEYQNAFIPGRLISDNIVVAHEIFHSLKARKRQSNSYMAVKTDITKAYDRLEWKFLQETMQHMVLSHLCIKAMNDRSLLGVKIAVQTPAVNHLLFADDSLFFSLANVKAEKKLKSIFSKYEAVSGQAINLNKSTITFGSRVRADIRTRMRNVLGIHNEGVKQVVQGWKQKHLTQGGKEVLLKSIALAMPIFSMNIFRLPKDICEEINAILARFWWGSGEKRGLHWYAWRRVCIPKKEGGLGFRDLESFNQALLGKQVWRILQNPNILMARILRARYFPDGNILNATLKRKASYAWKSILHGKELIVKGMRYIIGNGTTTKMWEDSWLSLHPPRPPRPRRDINHNMKVSDYINDNRTGWNMEKLREDVVEEDLATIQALRISSKAEQDLLGWHYNDNDLYTVKSGYWLATHLPDNNFIPPTYGNVELKKTIWNTKLPTKLQHFLWRLSSRSIATGNNLRRRHVTRDVICKRCWLEEETEEHLFFNFPYARKIWRASEVMLENGRMWIIKTRMHYTVIVLLLRYRRVLVGLFEMIEDDIREQYMLKVMQFVHLWKANSKLSLWHYNTAGGKDIRRL